MEQTCCSVTKGGNKLMLNFIFCSIYLFIWLSQVLIASCRIDCMDSSCGARTSLLCIQILLL